MVLFWMLFVQRQWLLVEVVVDHVPIIQLKVTLSRAGSEYIPGQSISVSCASILFRNCHKLRLCPEMLTTKLKLFSTLNLLL